MDKPRFIVGLLQNLGSYMDPLRIVSRIPKSLEIPNLKPALLQVLYDLETQISLKQGCREILIGDTLDLSKQLYELQRKGLAVQGFPPCSQCQIPVTPKEDGSLLIFFCQHVFHESCIENRGSVKQSQTLYSCPICWNQKSAKEGLLVKKGHRKRRNTQERKREK